VIDRKKQGFSSPLTYLLADEFPLSLQDVSERLPAGLERVSEPSVVNAMLKEHLEKTSDHGQRLWLLLQRGNLVPHVHRGLKKLELQQVLENVA